MSSFSQFKLKLYNIVDTPYSEKDGITEYGIKNYVDTSIASISGSLNYQTIYYDTFTVGKSGDSYPLTNDENSTGKRMSDRQGMDIWDNWNLCYSKCKVKLTVGGILYTGGDTYIGGPFENKDSLYIWINSLVPNDGLNISGHARIEIFDEIGDVPQLQKVYGYNNFFYGFAGCGNSRKSSTKTAMYGRSWLWDMFTDLTTHFVNATGALIAPISGNTIESENDNNKKIYWLPANKRNLYGLPVIGHPIRLAETVPLDFRKWWNENTSISVDQIEADAGGHDLVERAVVAMHYDTQTWEIMEINSVQDNYWTDNIDVDLVNVYLVKHSSLDGRFAFYVKPIGIGHILVDWFDQNKYRLEVIGFNKDKQPRLKPIITQQSSYESDFFGDRTVIPKSSWAFGDGLNQTRNCGSVLPRKVKFRLRRLTDNKVGPLTSATVKLIRHTIGARSKWVVC